MADLEALEEFEMTQDVTAYREAVASDDGQRISLAEVRGDLFVSYRVEFTGAAARQVKKLPKPVHDRVLDAIESSGEDPRPRGAKKLVGEQTAWRIRVGEYRVIYDVLDA